MCSEEDDRKNPRPVHVTLAEDVKTGKDGQTEGMERQVSKPSPFHDHDSQKKHKPSRIYYYFYGVVRIYVCCVPLVAKGSLRLFVTCRRLLWGTVEQTSETKRKRGC